MTINDINSLFQALDAAEPLIDYVETPKAESEFQNNEALARMYSDEGFRRYLEQNLNSAIKASALKSINEVDIAFGKARALTLKEILVKARRAYINFEKLRKIKEQIDEKRKNSQSNGGV